MEHEPMTDDWEVLAVYHDAGAADIVAGLLRSESIAVEVHRDEPVPGLFRSTRLKVPRSLLQRSREILAQAEFSDEELTRLALGEDGGTQEP